MATETQCRIALSFLPQIGDVVARHLIEHFGDASSIFKASRRELERIAAVGPSRAAAIRAFRDFDRTDAEIRFMERNNIRAIFWTDEDYPAKLRHCWDAPVLLYAGGAVNLQAPRMLGIVGTRRPTAYGVACCKALVSALAPFNVTIVSGMAYGIDITAHQAALEAGLPTIGVLAHGLDRLYPSQHARIARQMRESGGLISDFPSGTALNRMHFPRRNRVVAGICDGILVMESGESGGSLITADLANGYNRDVMAIPGRIGDAASAGCLALIRENKAALVTSAEDIAAQLNWRQAAISPQAAIQTALFRDLEPQQRLILDMIGEGRLSMDEIQYKSGIPRSQVAGDMLTLEMLGMVRALPGHTFQRLPA
ncbi:DNA-processing protein DprA [Chitinophaga deserti]|uniref:DNA-processing protein DprA n=1 Tax=Chitinophaga deserti TaxID=2164099 RepID=UPI000D6BC794|nr:DNA-processing protein DprA [Chitinophaga deserti]